MTENNFGILVSLNADYDLGIPDETFDKAEFLIYLSDGNKPLESLGMDDVIGFTHTNILSIGDTYSNPFDNNTYLKIIDIDSDTEQVFVELRRF